MLLLTRLVLSSPAKEPSKQGSAVRVIRELGFVGAAGCWAVLGHWDLQCHPRQPQDTWC